MDEAYIGIWHAFDIAPRERKTSALHVVMTSCIALYINGDVMRTEYMQSVDIQNYSKKLCIHYMGEI